MVATVLIFTGVGCIATAIDSNARPWQYLTALIGCLALITAGGIP